MGIRLISHVTGIQSSDFETPTASTSSCGANLFDSCLRRSTSWEISSLNLGALFLVLWLFGSNDDLIVLIILIKF